MPAVDEGLTSVSFLSRALGRPVRSVRSVDRLGADRGYAGTVLRLVLDTAQGGPATVIAKTGGLGGLDAMEREVAFYRDVAAQVRAPTPRCWYAGHMPDGAPVVIMDEVPDAVAGDALAGADADEVEAVLAAMVPVWRHGSGPPADQLPAMPVDPAVAVRRQQRYARQWRTVGESVGGRRLPEPMHRLGERLCTGLVPVLTRLAAAPPTVVHADLHLDNVLFANGDGARRSAAVIDWASACLAPVAVDLFPFVATSLSAEDQDRHADRLIGQVARWLGITELGALVDQGRCALARHFAGVIGWHSRPASGDDREAALRAAALDDGRLLNALTRWDVAGLVSR